jgi:hypothetical protein
MPVDDDRLWGEIHDKSNADTDLWVLIASTVLCAYSPNSLGLSMTDAQRIVTPLVKCDNYQSKFHLAYLHRDFKQLGEHRKPTLSLFPAYFDLFQSSMRLSRIDIFWKKQMID